MLWLCLPGCCSLRRELVVLVACWSVKGGVGVTTTVSTLAVAAAGRRDRGPTTVVDLVGDVPACLGLPEPGGPGVAEWLASGEDTPPDALGRLHQRVADGLELVPRGHGPLHPERAALLVQVLAATLGTVLVDAGRVDQCEVARRVATDADRSLLVARLCALGIGRARQASVRPTGVVVVRDPGRVLTVADVERAVGAPVVADLATDPAVARAVDAGLLVGRLPRQSRAAAAAVLR